MRYFSPTANVTSHGGVEVILCKWQNVIYSHQMQIVIWEIGFEYTVVLLSDEQFKMWGKDLIVILISENTSEKGSWDRILFT